MANNRFYQFLHPTSASLGIETVPSTFLRTSADNGTVAFIFQQFNRATPSITGDTFGNNPPSAGNVTPDADETLSRKRALWFLRAQACVQKKNFSVCIAAKFAMLYVL